jgi:ATP-dependent DNA helicase RecG
MRSQKIIKLIGVSESQAVEWKPSLAQDAEIVTTVAAFANTDGGKVVVGVTDAGNLSGLKVGKSGIESLTNKIHQHLEPKIHPKISLIEIDGSELIVIEVKPALDKTVLAFGRPYKRVGKSTVKMGKDEYERLILEKHKDRLQFDKEICKAAGLEEIDKEKVAAYLKLRAKNRNIPLKIKIPLGQFLANISAITDKKLTNAGVLFFGKNPLRFISQAQLRLARIKGTKIYGNILDRLDCEGTLWEMVDQAEYFIRKSIRLLGFRTDKSFRREDRFEYPIRALREAIINGLIHRDYFNLADVRVFIFDDRVEIVSPGPFPEGVTPQKPLHKPVNKVLSDLMYDIGYIEKYGSGIYLENQLCRENKNPKPVYEIDHVQTKVIFKSQIKDVTVVELKDEILAQLNERQKKAVEFIAENGEISRKQYLKLVDISVRQANKDLDDLLNKKIVVPLGSGRSTRYKMHD